MNGWHCNGIAELFIRGSIGDPDYEIIREPLKPRPFSWGHSSYTIVIHFTFYPRSRGKVFQPLVDDKVSFSSHSSYYDCIGDSIVRYDFISESIPFCRMTLFVSNKSFYVLSRKIVL